MNQSKLLVWVAAVGLAGAITARTVIAQGSSQGKGKQTEPAAPTVAVGVQIQIGSRDRETITKYYVSNPAGLPPGLAKRGGDLPPGLDKQLKRNGSLPPGLQKKLEPFPVALERQVMKLPSGYNWFVLGTHVVIVNRQANLVGDFALNIVR